MPTRRIEHVLDIDTPRLGKNTVSVPIRDSVRAVNVVVDRAGFDLLDSRPDGVRVTMYVQTPGNPDKWSGDFGFAGGVSPTNPGRPGQKDLWSYVTVALPAGKNRKLKLECDCEVIIPLKVHVDELEP